MTLHAGTVANFSGSLAEQIELAFASELFAVKGLPLPAVARDERRILFCAIAQGMLLYLAAHPDGLPLHLTSSSGAVNPAGGVPDGGTVQPQVVK